MRHIATFLLVYYAASRLLFLFEALTRYIAEAGRENVRGQVVMIIVSVCLVPIVGEATFIGVAWALMNGRKKLPTTGEKEQDDE